MPQEKTTRRRPHKTGRKVDLKGSRSEKTMFRGAEENLNNNRSKEWVESVFLA